MRILDTCKDVIRPFVFKYPWSTRVSGKKSFGLNLLDLKLSEWLDYRNGYYVELGANDGNSQSNTKLLELFRDWNGILIEPSPRKFIELTKNRSKRNAFFNCACVSFEYPDSSIDLLYSNLMTVALSGKSDIKDRLAHAQSGKPLLKKEDNYRFTANARTLQSLLDEAGAPASIDLLSLDVEGSELEVLNGVDFSRNHFKYVLVETRSIEEMTKFLESHKYACVAKLSHHDYLFKFSG
jgi:FkbM family methyltransferase